MLYSELTTGVTKLPCPVARSVIRQNSFYLDAEWAYHETVNHKTSTADSAVSSRRTAVYAALEASSTHTCRYSHPGRLR